ncbi:hypothetical protein CcaCcLH18_08405 [Colletotrichum camelliae]|nr:hypothetical protein CcaCcLH18_08405 [Colletotrichum camelliae]
MAGQFKRSLSTPERAHGFDDKVGTPTLGPSIDLGLRVRHTIQKIQRILSKLLHPLQAVAQAVHGEGTSRSNVSRRNDGTKTHRITSHHYDCAVTDGHTDQHPHTAFRRVISRGKYVSHENKCFVGDCRWSHDSCGIGQWNSNVLRLPAI